MVTAGWCPPPPGWIFCFYQRSSSPRRPYGEPFRRNPGQIIYEPTEQSTPTQARGYVKLKECQTLPAHGYARRRRPRTIRFAKICIDISTPHHTHTHHKVTLHLTLDPLEALASLGFTGLLALDHTGVAREQARFLERRAERGLVQLQRARDAVAQRLRRAGGSLRASTRPDIGV